MEIDILNVHVYIQYWNFVCTNEIHLSHNYYKLRYNFHEIEKRNVNGGTSV